MSGYKLICDVKGIYSVSVHVSCAEIALTFINNLYELDEDAGVQTELIRVVKQDNKITEQVLNILVLVFELSTINAANKGK